MGLGFTQTYEIKARPSELMWCESVRIEKGKIKFFIPKGYKAYVIFEGRDEIIEPGVSYSTSQFSGTMDVYAVNCGLAEQDVDYGAGGLGAFHPDGFPEVEVHYGVYGIYRIKVDNYKTFFFSYFNKSRQSLTEIIESDYREIVGCAVRDSVNTVFAGKRRTESELSALSADIKDMAQREINSALQSRGLHVDRLTMTFSKLEDSEEITEKINRAVVENNVETLKRRGGEKADGNSLGEADGEENFCPSCGVKLPPYARYCPQCKESVRTVSSVSYCPHCGNKYDGKGSFCAHCGNRIN